jgi:two-component system, NarL family, nitrate/nitrite response regulator NarL
MAFSLLDRTGTWCENVPDRTMNTLRPVRVVIADDESMFRTCLRQLLTAPPSVVKDVYGVDVGAGFEVIGEAATGEDTVGTVQSTQPDLLLLDLSMPRLSGLEALRELQRCERTRTVILSGTLEKAQVLTAIRLGARGLIAKASATEQLFEAIMAVMAGQSWLARTQLTDLMEVLRTRVDAAHEAPASQPFGLTPREREVLSLVVEGCGNKEIATRLTVSEETIKHHLTRMFDKVGAANRLELALVATRHHLAN